MGKKIQFLVQDVPGQGNCLFEAIGRSANISASVLRRAAVQWMLVPNRTLHGEKIDNWVEWNTGQTLQRYASSISRDGEWGSGIELAVISSLLNCAILVYEKQSNTQQAVKISEFLPDGSDEQSKGALPTLAVLYVNRSQYMQLIYKQTE